MKQIIYALDFRGQGGPGPKEGTMSARTSAKPARTTTKVGASGIDSSIDAVGGTEATFESIVTLTGESSFLESGSITFGEGNRLHFSTVGQGYLAGSADPKLRAGIVNWRIDSGEGQFEGATGLITSNFTVSDVGEVVDYQFGVIFLK